MTFPADFSTPQRMITQAMRNAGLIGQLTVPESSVFAEYMPRLNDYINYLQIKGLKLWLNFDQSVTLVQGQSLYTFFPTGDVDITKPMRFVDGYFLDQTNNRRPLYATSWTDWIRLSNVVNQGAVTQYFADKQRDRINCNFWLTPDAEAALGTAHIIIQRQVTEVVELDDTMDFPQEWFIGIHWGFAADICTGQPKEVIARCERMAEKYLTDLENWDVEDTSTYFQPDSRGTQNMDTGRFK